MPNEFDDRGRPSGVHRDYPRESRSRRTTPLGTLCRVIGGGLILLGIGLAALGIMGGLERSGPSPADHYSSGSFTLQGLLYGGIAFLAGLVMLVFGRVADR